MDPAEHLAALRSATAGLAAAARLGTSAPVPSCPGWTVGHLVAHLAVVHHRATVAVATAATDPVRAPEGWARAPDDPDLVDWFEREAATMAATLEAAGPDAPAWHWFPDRTVRTWCRRMAHETVVHRWDAEHAHGVERPVEPVLAADGVDELVALMVPSVAWRKGPPSGVAPAGERIRLEATDADDAWLVTFEGERPRVDRGAGAGRGDATLRGTASDLLLAGWGRLPLAVLEVDGDLEVAARWPRLAPPP